jgi:hypothetical protein
MHSALAQLPAAIAAFGKIEQTLRLRGIHPDSHVFEGACFTDAFTRADPHSLYWTISLPDDQHAGHRTIPYLSAAFFPDVRDKEAQILVEFGAIGEGVWSIVFLSSSRPGSPADALGKHLQLEVGETRQLTESEAFEAVGIIGSYFKNELVPKAAPPDAD